MICLFDEGGISYTFFTMATGRKNRVRVHVCIEKRFVELAKQENLCLSDVINWLLEKYFEELNLFDSREEIQKLVAGRYRVTSF